MMDTVTITQRHLPPELRGLPCIRAEVAHVIAPGKATPSLEGPIFDRHGNFYCCLTAPNDTYVKKISLDGSISDFFHSDSGMTVGLVFHQDGRCFAADMLRNCIRILSADGKLLEELPLQYEGRKLRPDCMVFDRKGDLLFTDLSGTFRDPIGGVYRLTQDSGYHELSLYVGNLASPDGITLSPDGKSLWVSECSSNSVLRFLLDGQGEPRIAQHTPLQAYRNSGASNVDNEGSIQLREEDDLPSFWASFFPVIFLIAFCFVLIVGFKVNATQAVVYSTVLSTILLYLLCRKTYRGPGVWKSVQSSAEFIIPNVMAASCVFGFASVVSKTTAFGALSASFANSSLNPYVLVVVAVMLLAGITASGLSGQNAFNAVLGQTMMDAGVNMQVVHRLGSIAASTFDSMPYSSYISLVLPVFGYDHKSGYKYLVVANIIIPVIYTLFALAIALIFY